MQVTRINDRLSVAPQIGAADLGAVAAAGFRAVICNRPDGEEPGQPGFAEIRAAAEAAGLKAAYVPAAHGQIGPALAADFARALDALPGPVLAYCRSGARSATLWQLAEAAGSRAA